MRLWHLGLGFSLATGLGLAASVGCAAGNTSNTGGGGATAAGGSGGTLTIGGNGGGLIDAGQPDGFGACAKFNAEAKQAPAAIMFILDGSASMNMNSKWDTAQLAVVQAIDKDVFDTMQLGLVTFPTKFEDPPACICAFLGLDPDTCKALLAPGVSCGVPVLPQIPLALAGPEKSNAPTGVRHNLYQYLVGAQPLSNGDDGSPIYEALVAGYNTLKASTVDRRIAVLITDGGFSCTSVGKTQAPRPAYSDGYGCPDWEQPAEVAKLIDGARTDPAAPIDTFIVGVPGSNSHGEKQGTFDTPPYSMRLALSTYAVSGSPDSVDPACDKGAVFTQGGADPAGPCHIDLSNGASFNADALASAITAIRGKALGCVYDLPKPPPGESIDQGQVNVVVTVDGADTTVPKRKDATDACLTEPCWDYNDKGQVELIGLACSSVSGAESAKVEIYVGCATVIK